MQTMGASIAKVDRVVATKPAEKRRSHARAAQDVAITQSSNGIKSQEKRDCSKFSVLEGNVEIDRSSSPKRLHYRVVLA